MASEREDDLIKHFHGKIMGFMIRNQAPGMDKLSEITKHIYISNWKNSCDLQLLRENGIKGVLCVTNQKKPEAIMKGYEKRNITHMQLPFATPAEGEKPDNIIVHAQKMTAYILGLVSNEDRVLVHCQDGVSISPAVVAIYMLTRYYTVSFMNDMEVTKKLVNPEEMFMPVIIKMLKEYRPCIVIHPAFTWQILVGEMLLKRQFATEYRKYLAQQRREKSKSTGKSTGKGTGKDTGKGTGKDVSAKKVIESKKKDDDDTGVPLRVKPAPKKRKEEVLSDDDISDYISKAIEKHSEFDELSDLKGIRAPPQKVQEEQEIQEEQEEQSREESGSDEFTKVSDDENDDDLDFFDDLE
jgi:predicted protein tyrosine phosphatase